MPSEYNKGRFIIVTATEMTMIAQKLAVYKAFRVYPLQDQIEAVVNPDLVKDENMVYVLDKKAMDNYVQDYVNLEDAFARGLFDESFLAMNATDVRFQRRARRNV